MEVVIPIVLLLPTHVMLLLGKLFCYIIRNCTYDLIFIHFTVELVSVELLLLVELKILATDVSESKLPFQSQLLSYDTYFMNLQHLKNATN